MSGRGGFASLRREASVRPHEGNPPVPPGDAPPPPSEGLSDNQERFLAGLSPAAREATLRRLAKARNRDPRKVSQDELDDMDDEQKWDWLESTCRAETADQERAAATAAQTQMEGHHQ